MGALLLATGCYSYVPTDLAAISPGEPVRVEMSREAMAELLRSGESSVGGVGPLVSGTLSRREGGEILVRVPVSIRQEGLRRPIGQDVRIPAVQVLGVGRRQVNWLGTALTIGAGLGAAAFVASYIMDGAGAEGTPPVQEPDNLRVQAERLRVVARMHP